MGERYRKATKEELDRVWAFWQDLEAVCQKHSATFETCGCCEISVTLVGQVVVERFTDGCDPDQKPSFNRVPWTRASVDDRDAIDLRVKP